MGSVRDRQQTTKRLSLPNMQVQLTSAATSDETARNRTSGGRNQQQTSSRSSNQASQSDNVMSSSTEHRGQETSNRKPMLTAGQVNKAEQRPAEPLKPPPRRKFKNASSAGDFGKKGKLTQSSAESDSHRQETTPRVDVSTTSDQTGSSCDDSKINSTTSACTHANSLPPQVDDNNCGREVATNTLESDLTRSSQSPQKNSILKKSTSPSKSQSVLPTPMTQQRLQRQMLNQQKRARQRDAVDPNSTNSPRRVLFKNNVSVYRFDVDSNNVILEDHVDSDDIRLGRRNGDSDTAMISPSVPSPGQAVPRSPPVTMTTMQELASDYDKKRTNISRLHVTHQPIAPKGRLIISDKFPTLTNANQDSPSIGIYGQDQQQMWWQHDANEQIAEAGFFRDRRDSYDPTLTADGHWIADESNRKTVFFVFTSSSPPDSDAGSLQSMSNKTTAGRRLISSNQNDATTVAARSMTGDNADDDSNNIPQLQLQQHLLRRKGVTNHLPSHRESSTTSSTEPLRQPGGYRRLMIAFKLPLNDSDGGQPFTADSLLVKANRDGCRVRVVSTTSPRSANVLPPGVQQQQQRRGQNSADSARDVTGGWADADFQLNEQLNLPYAVDPYRVVARLEPDSTLVIEAPIVEPS